MDGGPGSFDTQTFGNIFYLEKIHFKVHRCIFEMLMLHEIAFTLRETKSVYVGLVFKMMLCSKRLNIYFYNAANAPRVQWEWGFVGFPSQWNGDFYIIAVQINPKM